jgi:hypothetical protein
MAVTWQENHGDFLTCNGLPTNGCPASGVASPDFVYAHRFALFVVTLSLSILLSEGWLGPVTALLALCVPPEIKTFTVSLWVAMGQILAPVVTTVCSIYLAVRLPK